MAWKRAKLWNKSLWRWIIPVNIISLAYRILYRTYIYKHNNTRTHHRRICLHYCYFTYTLAHTRTHTYTYTYVQLSYNFISPGRLSPVSDISFGITRRKIILSKLPSLPRACCAVLSQRVVFSICVFVFSPINAAKSRATNFR